MKTLRVLPLLILSLLMVRSAVAAEPDAALIGKIPGFTPDVKDGIAKVSVPRDDLGMAIDWVLENGLQVTGLDDHFFFGRPYLFVMHIGGRGTTEQLSTGVRNTVDAANAAPQGADFAGGNIPAKSTIDPMPLEMILGRAAQVKDGVARFFFVRKTSMHATEVGEAITWAAFGGSQQAAVVDGDVAMLEDELQGILKALRRANINIGAIHPHMTHEGPRIIFLHFWAEGPAADLARSLKSVLDTQRGGTEPLRYFRKLHFFEKTDPRHDRPRFAPEV